MLRLEGVCAGYHGLQILHELDLHVDEGEIVAVVGANGAGKTTTLKTISGLLRPTSGSVVFDGAAVEGVRPSELVRRGLVHVPEGRALFGPLTVEENLRMGGWTRGRELARRQHARGARALPRPRRAQPTARRDTQRRSAADARDRPRPDGAARSCSCSTSRRPVCRQSSPGTCSSIIETIRDRGVAVLLVEQNASQALNLADRAYVLESGSVVLDGPGPELAQDDRVRAAYLGL